MNIFEGARRIAFLIAGLIFLGGMVAIYNSTPRVIIEYKVLYFGINPLRLSGCETTVDATRYNDYTTPSGKPFSIRTCFKAARSDDGRMLIPYAEAPENRAYLNSEFSDDVRAYTQSVSGSIVPTPVDFKDADDEYFRQGWVERLKSLGVLLLSILVYWISVKIVGWIVRGFLGIKAGQDYRIQPLEK